MTAHLERLPLRTHWQGPGREDGVHAKPPGSQASHGQVHVSRVLLENGWGRGVRTPTGEQESGGACHQPGCKADGRHYLGSRTSGATRLRAATPAPLGRASLAGTAGCPQSLTWHGHPPRPPWPGEEERAGRGAVSGPESAPLRYKPLACNEAKVQRFRSSVKAEPPAGFSGQRPGLRARRAPPGRHRPCQPDSEGGREKQNPNTELLRAPPSRKIRLR